MQYSLAMPGLRILINRILKILIGVQGAMGGEVDHLRRER